MSLDRATTPLVVIGAVAALLGGGAAIWGCLYAPQAFFPAWLAAFYFWLSMPAGALGLLLIWDLTGGRWGPIARLPLTAMAATIPLFLPLYLPIVAGISVLYPWTQSPVAAKLHNGWYLNREFFFIRAGFYFLIWIGFAAWRVLRRSASDGGPSKGYQWLSGVGVLLMGYSLTYCGIDWLMSTEPDWFSSIYGMVVGSGQFIAAISCALILLVIGARSTSDVEEHAFKPGLASLAAVLVAVIVFWAYTSFCQWLVIWEENLHSEIHWFIERWAPPWGGVIYALAVAHFFVPFMILVWSPVKRKPRLVGAVCGLLLLADLLQVWWLVLPGFPQVGFSWLDPAVMVCVGGLWLLALARALSVLRDRIPAQQREAAHA
jgi:hypothetical protein